MLGECEAAHTYKWWGQDLKSASLPREPASQPPYKAMSPEIGASHFSSLYWQIMKPTLNFIKPSLHMLRSHLLKRACYHVFFSPYPMKNSAVKSVILALKKSSPSGLPGMPPPFLYSASVKAAKNACHF